MTEKERIKEILNSEAIRRVDGRYSGGFVDLNILQELIDEGSAIVKEVKTLDFVYRMEEQHD